MVFQEIFGGLAFWFMAPIIALAILIFTILTILLVKKFFVSSER